MAVAGSTSLSRAERAALIEQYVRGPARLRGALAAVPAAAVKWRPAAGEWSAHEVIWHCADSEMNAAARIRYLAAEPEPLVLGYDQDTWARLFDYHAHPLEPALAVVDAVRGYTAEVIRRLSDEAWGRRGRHTESGPYGAEDWLRIYAAHLEIHSRQIEDNVARWRASGGA
jgi:hypothetical protein